MLVSIVLNIMNEERNIADLLDSLVIQEQPLEVIVVDAKSKDRTREIVKPYLDKYGFIKMYIKSGSRGESTNFGISKANGDIIAFTGGDCIANPNWIKELRNTIEGGADIAAGKTINMGLRAWEELDRVELFHKGFDVSFPSCNMAFRREVIQKVGGFDTWFITAEDIDLTYRAVDAGYKLEYNSNAVIYHRTKSTLYGFFRQAFWNGAGRKQLTLKHGRLWGNYDPLRMVRQKMTFWSFSRLTMAMMGYIAFKLFDDHGPYGRRGRLASASEEKRGSKEKASHKKET
jgi:cellulose synthase/poly-beta-1,6-N-acetylglucosamine synthase-like glycosyltransferase